MDVGGVLVSILFAAFSLPCLLLLLVIAEAGFRLAALGLRGGRYAWPTRSAFLSYRIARAGVGGLLPSSSDPPAGGLQQDEAPLPPECRDRLAVALYRRGKGPGPDQPDAAVDCVFCLSRVDEGDEVRELRCRHVFHRACLDAWLVHPRATCPLCRDRLLPSDPPLSCALDDDDDVDFSFISYPHAGALWYRFFVLAPDRPGSPGPDPPLRVRSAPANTEDACITQSLSLCNAVMHGAYVYSSTTTMEKYAT